jgi:hypothetical protein
MSGAAWSLAVQLKTGAGLLLAHLDGGQTEAVRSFRPLFEVSADAHLPNYTKADIGPRPADGAESITRQVR